MQSFPNGARGEGFSFKNVDRNAKVLGTTTNLPKAISTGTTICGVVFEGGVCLAADTRSTAGPVVADLCCKKIHIMAPNILCCGAGTAADTEMVTQMVASNLILHRLETRKQSRVVQALTMLKRHLFGYQGYVSAALVLGGVDVDGPFLGTIAPHGSTDRLPFVAMGSGSLAAMGVLESGYKDGMTADDAKALVTSAIAAGIFNDPFSGTQVDCAVITKDRTEMTYGHFQPNADEPSAVKCTWNPKATFIPKEDSVPASPPKSNQRAKLIDFPPGTTPLSKEQVRNIVTVEEVPVSRD